MAARRYRVTVGGRELEVEIGGGDGARDIVVDGQAYSAELLPANSAGVRRLRLEGRARELMLDVGAGRCAVAVDGVTIDVLIEDERLAQLAGFGGGTSGTAPGAVLAPMPGLVVRVNVQVGQAVARAESLVVLQAMKMENELGSPRDGRVKAVSVVAGQAVEQGQVLVELE